MPLQIRTEGGLATAIQNSDFLCNYVNDVVNVPHLSNIVLVLQCFRLAVSYVGYPSIQ